MLTKQQFDLLVRLEAEKAPLSPAALAEALAVSADAAGRTLQELTESGLVAAGALTEKGLRALEPYRTRRAVFMAAGFGSRMLPITLTTPKPLVRVKGKRIIETMLDACIAAEIEEIYIVRGYLAEQFDQLLYKYPQIKFIENPEFNTSNNITSVLYACDKLENAYVLEADLYLSNPNLITKYQYSSNYLGIPVEHTDDWYFYTKDGYIAGGGFGGGGENCYQTVGISYWTKEDGKKLFDHVKIACSEPGGKDHFWGYVPRGRFKDEYKISARPCKFEDIVEIDTLDELKAIDPSYAN